MKWSNPDFSRPSSVAESAAVFSKDWMLTKILVPLVSVLVLVSLLKYLFNKTFWSLFAIFTLSWTSLEHSFKIKTFEIEQKSIWVKIDLLVDHRHGASFHFSQVRSEWMRQKLTGIINIKKTGHISNGPGRVWKVWGLVWRICLGVWVGGARFKSLLVGRWVVVRRPALCCWGLRATCITAKPKRDIRIGALISLQNQRRIFNLLSLISLQNKKSCLGKGGCAKSGEFSEKF